MKLLLSHIGLRGRVALVLAAIAGMLVASAPAASALPAAGAHHRTRITAVRINFRRAPVRPGGHRLASPHAPAAAPDLSSGDCQTAYLQGQAGSQGWAQSRFAACTLAYGTASKLVSYDGGQTWVTVGALYFHMTDVNLPSNSGASVTHQVIVDNTSAWGDITNLQLSFTTACNNSQPTSGNCSPQSSGTTTYDASTLLLAGSVTISSTYGIAPGGNADQSSYNWTQTQVTVTDIAPGAGPPDTAYSTPTGFRCDYASYFATPGCVIDWAPTPVLFYDSTSYPLVGPVAQHIYDAQHGGLFTPWGEPGYPLTRDTSPSDMNMNNQTACGNFVPPDDVNTSCDEYPLQSTYEGAWFQPDFSVRGVPPSANSSQGGLTIGFYNSQRILDGDAFYVDPILPDGTYSW